MLVDVDHSYKTWTILAGWPGPADPGPRPAWVEEKLEVKNVADAVKKLKSDLVKTQL